MQHTMMRWIGAAALAGCAAVALAAESVPAPKLTAAQIVEKNVAARGGLEAWRKIQSMIWVGRVESPDAPMPSMPFVLQQKRPNKTRFEITGMSQKSLRVYDGVQGWKAVPTHEGSSNVQPFTAQELTFARQAHAIDGPLIDYEAKGSAVVLEAIEELEGHKAYRLSVRLASGERSRVWIDAQSFLDVRVDRTSYNSAGVPGTVSVFYRDYRTVEGLQIPATIETGPGSGKATNRLVIEKIALNPPLDDEVFTRPDFAARHDARPRGAEYPAGVNRPRASPSAGPDAASPNMGSATP